MREERGEGEISPRAPERLLFCFSEHINDAEAALTAAEKSFSTKSTTDAEFGVAMSDLNAKRLRYRWLLSTCAYRMDGFQDVLSNAMIKEAEAGQ